MNTNTNTEIEALRNMSLPVLTGTAKQVVFADKIRKAWLNVQCDLLIKELAIIGGDFSGLEIQPNEDFEALRDGFVSIYCKRLNGTKADMMETSASKWINGAAGRWVLNYGPLSRKGKK